MLTERPSVRCNAFLLWVQYQQRRFGGDDAACLLLLLLVVTVAVGALLL